MNKAIIEQVDLYGNKTRVLTNTYKIVKNPMCRQNKPDSGELSKLKSNLLQNF